MNWIDKTTLSNRYVHIIHFGNIRFDKAQKKEKKRKTYMSLLPYQHVDSVASLYDVDEIYDFINSGTYASVYRGVRREHTPPSIFSCVQPGKTVALKVIPKSNLKTEKDIRDVINEVSILKCVHHEHILRILEVFQTNREVCLVLELVEGKELLRGLGPSVVFAEERAKKIVSQIFQALFFLHEQKRVVHRDLKPENILIDSADHVTIVDFGLAKFFGHGRRGIGRHLSKPSSSLLQSMLSTLPSSEATASLLHHSPSMESVDSTSSHTNSPILATPCGTLRYAAPETVKNQGNGQWSTTRGSMPKLDVYSVGIIVFIMLCGQLPYDTKNKVTLAAQMEAGPKFSGPKWGTVSREAVDFVEGLLAADPDKRMTSAEALMHPWIKLSHDEGMPSPTSTQCYNSEDFTLPLSSTSATAFNEEDARVTANDNRNVLSTAFSAMLPVAAEDCEEPNAGRLIAGDRHSAQVSYFF